VIKSLLTTLLFLIVFCFLQAQNLTTGPKPVHRQFSVDDGLPSNETYHIVQDSIGYLWIATANGVSRFDGYSFKNFGVNEGLVESTIHEIFIDYKGRIWFISSSGRLAYFEDDEIKPFAYNHRLNDYIAQSRGTIKKSFYVDTLDNVYISFRGIGRIVVSAEGIVTEPHEIQDVSIIVEKHPDGPLLVSNKSIYGSQYNDLEEFKKRFLFSFRLPNDTFNIQNTNVRSPFHFIIIEESHNKLILSNGGRVMKVENRNIISYHDFGYEVIWTSLEYNNNLWVAPIEGGVHRLHNGHFNHPNNLFILEKYQISSVERDHENGYWFTSLANGIFYIPNINILTYNEESGLPSERVNTVFANRAGVYAGSEQGTISHIQNQSITNYTLRTDSLGVLPIRFIGIDSTSSHIWIGTSAYLHSMDKNNNVKDYFSSQTMGSHPRDMIHSSDGGYWIASSWGISKFDGESFVYTSRLEHEFSGIVNSVYEDSTRAVWMATNNGVWKYHSNIYEYMGEKHSLFAQSASYITCTFDKKLLVSTKGIGLLVFDGINLWQITQSNGIASNYINKIFVAPSGIWLATNSGVSLITGDLAGNFNVTNINTSHGLPTNETTDIFVRGSLAYVSTTKGLSVININNFKPNEVSTKCLITDFILNGQSYGLKEQPIEVDYGNNTIEIDYVGFAFKNFGRIQYRYRFDGPEAKWVYTTTPTSTFSQLSPGNYSFQVQAQNSDGIWGQTAEIQFTIRPAIWQTYWFIIISTLFFTLFIYLIYRLRIASIKKRNNLVNNLNVYKQKSLRQQMNPHFIFNTLNSIQLYILEKDHISSHKYLTKFAKLMRLILDNSQVSSIPLKDELEALRLYLELESLRLSGKFEYYIEVENDKLLELRVPTLLIQPFVENSIWHGIMLKTKQEGWVKVHIAGVSNVLICTIEDNGVGRKLAQEIRAKQDPERKSLGFKITAQRIDLLNSLYKERFDIKYFDINNPDGSTGTKVVIRIPQDVLEENGFD